jgi:amicoumacin kinase
MEQRIKDRYNDAILQEAMHRYGIQSDQIHLLDGFESYIYEFHRADGDFILRIGHSLRRRPSLIHAEVDWINYLAAGGVSVARAIQSQNDQLVEEIDDGMGGQFLATAFVKARGQHPRRSGWTPALFETYGQLIGKMHSLTQRYTPTNPDWRRPTWNDADMEFVERFLPATEATTLQRYRDLRAHLDALPMQRDSYGLVHYDSHGGNLFIDDAGSITLFDFDDCCYSWFANDIAIVLFYNAIGEADETAFTRLFMTHFLRGYRKVNQLDPRWLSEIPNFLKLREIELYSVIHRDFDVDNIADAWCARYMHNRKHKIENDVPFLAFDFESLRTSI